MDVRTILDAPVEGVARAASTAADAVEHAVEHAVARVDHAVPLPGRKARRKRHLSGWVGRNRRTFLVAGGLGAVAMAALAAKRHLAAPGSHATAGRASGAGAASRPTPGSAAMATSGAVSPEAGPGSTLEYGDPDGPAGTAGAAGPADPTANGRAPRGAGLHSTDGS